MSQIFLTQVNLSKLPELTSLLENEGFRHGFNEDTGFLKQFKPNTWSNSNVTVNIFRSGYPLEIQTNVFKGTNIEDDPYLSLIKKVIQVVECKEDVRSGGNVRYDISIFYK